MARVLISKAQADLTNFGLNIPPGMDAGALQNVRRTMQLLNANANPFQRSKNRTTQSDLSDFGVPEQEVAVRQPMPTAEEMERIIREGDIALTPREFATKVPLIDRNTEGIDERFGGTAKNFGEQMGLEGSIAHGLIAREYPQIMDFEDPLAVPFIRDYYSRQSTLPEHFWNYHTEGPYYDEEGNILPGQVPPVDAVKLMSESDIRYLGGREGVGLKPVPFSQSNLNWEKDEMPLSYRMPVKNAGFVGGLTEQDILRNQAGNVSATLPKGVVAIRGFGRPQDKAFARSVGREGREAIYTAPIPPERLVGVMPSTRMTENELKGGALRHLYAPEKPFEQKLHELVSDGIISPINAMYAMITHRAQQKHSPEHLFENPNPLLELYPSPSSLIDTDAGEEEMQRVGGWRTPFPTPSKIARRQVESNFSDALPPAWQQGVFGLENPLLTEAEKEAYLKDIENMRIARMGYSDDDITPIKDIDPKKLRSLYPKQAGVRYA